MEHIKEFEKLIEEFSRLQYIKPSSLPGIDLYMDQVTTFMDEKLAHAKRPSSSLREEEIYEGAYAASDLYLLSEEYSPD